LLRFASPKQQLRQDLLIKKMLPLFKVAAVASVVLALVAAPAPVTAAVGVGIAVAAPVPDAAAVSAYRVDLWAYWASQIVANYDANVTPAFVSDLAGVFGTSESAVTITDCAVLPGTSQNISVVFTVEGGDDAPFLASPLEAQAPWTTAFNQLLYAYYYSDAREAAAAVDPSYYQTAYITNVQRLPSPDLLPKRRYLEFTLHGKHLATATAGSNWADSLAADLADAFGVNVDGGLHVTLTASASSGVNNSTVSVRFFVKPLLNVAVNRTTFFATNGTASWLARCQYLHFFAAAEDLGIPMVFGRGGRALDTVPESESALTVTGTAYAPGDESYTDAPTPTNAPGSVTNAPGDAAPGLATAASFIAATALLSAMSLF
jgi:hypothetical protein